MSDDRINALRAALEEIRADHMADCPCDSISWHALKRDDDRARMASFFECNAVCSCGEQAYNIHDGICGWCGSRVES